MRNNNTNNNNNNNNFIHSWMGEQERDSATRWADNNSSYPGDSAIAFGLGFLGSNKARMRNSDPMFPEMDLRSGKFEGVSSMDETRCASRVYVYRKITKKTIQVFTLPIVTNFRGDPEEGIKRHLMYCAKTMMFFQIPDEPTDVLIGKYRGESKYGLEQIGEMTMEEFNMRYL